MRDKNLLKVNDHKRTMALLCLKSKKHLNEIWPLIKSQPLLRGIVIVYIVWFQKISIPPPPTEDHWKFQGGGGFKGSNFPRGRGGSWETTFQRVTDHVQNI